VRIGPPRLKLAIVLALLVAAHFAVRPRFGPSPLAPDLVLVALLFYAIRSRPGAGAVAGFIVGLLMDAVTPTAFGANAFALTIVGFVSGWLKAVVFPDNLLVNAVFVFAASLARDVLQVLAAGQLRSGAGVLLVTSPLAALGTTAAALVTLVIFRGWLRGAPAR
jgi:rod shape-determining protein MreD